MRILTIGFVGLALILASCVTPPGVVQGTVILYDETGRTITMQDEDTPGSVIEFSFEGAEMGTRPQPGDVIRVAYLKQNDRLKATRIMNVSRQKELKTSH